MSNYFLCPHHKMIISTKNLGEGIRKMRKSSGLSQTQLAKECGIDLKTVTRIELNKISPNLRTLLIIINRLKSTARYSADEQVFLQIEEENSL